MSDLPPHATFVAPAISQLAPLFPGYEIETLIATGGMGAVYRALQKSLDRRVAIKILPREFSSDKAFCAGFEAEAKAMARLNHPNLIGVYDFGEVDGMLYIIMEYVPGKSLFHSSHGIALDPAEVIRLLTGICNGLAHAHDNGILHRDIKPSNILLDLHAEPKIGDFGLARPVERKIQEGEEIFGTPHYTAPEVIQAPQSVDFRADLFSVGVMLHELLTGKLPADDPRPASAICRCDPRFDAIIRRATHPQPEMRHASAAEIAKELQIIAASAGPRVLRTAAPQTAAPHQRPRPGSVARRPLATPEKSSGPTTAIISLIVVGVVIAAVLMLSNSPKAPTQPQPAKPITDGLAPSHDPSTTTPSHRPPSDSWSTPQKNQPSSTHSYASNDSGDPEDDESNESDDTSGTSSGHGSNHYTHHHSTAGHGSSSAGDEDDEKDTTSSATPKFNVEGFLLRARGIMQDKANPYIITRDKSLAENLKAFEREVKRLIRRIDSRDDRDTAEETLEYLMEGCIEKNNRLPKKPAVNLNLGSDYEITYLQYRKKQQEIDDTLLESLAGLAPTYILGIEKQIERLAAENDPAAIDLLKEEIETTRSSPDHFPDLMLGRSATEDQPASGTTSGGALVPTPER